MNEAIPKRNDAATPTVHVHVKLFFKGGKISYFYILVCHEHYLFSPLLHVHIVLGKDSDITLLAVSGLEIPASTITPPVTASSGQPMSPKTTFQQQQSYTPTRSSPVTYKQAASLPLYTNSRSPLSLLPGNEVPSGRLNAASKVVDTPTRKSDDVHGKLSQDCKLMQSTDYTCSEYLCWMLQLVVPLLFSNF